MKISYFHGKHPNFGDDLNLWLWPKLLPNFFDEDDSTVFLGIGSIIGERDFSPEVKKVLFGAGFVPEYHSKPNVKEPNWNVYFVRGPRTTELLELSPTLALGDPAILVRTLSGLPKKNPTIVSFMPHWESLDRGNWSRVCELAKIHLIDPRGTVDEVLQQILNSRLVITEAMHGAIVADAFRIPWIPILPLNSVHRAKWMDWARSLNLKLAVHRIFPSSLGEARLSFLRSSVMRLPFVTFLDDLLPKIAALRLKSLIKASPCLSDDEEIDRVTRLMQEKVELLRSDFSKDALNAVSPFADSADETPAPAPVSVVMAAHNAGQTIQRAIKSALKEAEVRTVIVIDDASTDDTKIQAMQADDGTGRLRVRILPRNVGPSAARNTAIKEARSDWVSILDADDFFLPGRMAALLKYADQADFIADDIVRLDENDPLGSRVPFLGSRLTEPRLVSFQEFIHSNIPDKRRPRGELGFIKPIMRRSFLEKNNLDYKEYIRLGEDYDLYARALSAGARLLLIPIQGYASMVRQTSLSGRHTETDLQNLRDCDESIGRIESLTSAEKRVVREHYLSTDCRLQWRLLILAYKNRDLKAALATFMRPMPVPTYLLKCLLEQLALRTWKRLKK